MEFRPSYKSAVIESTAVAILLTLVIGLFLYFTEKPLWFSAAFAVVSGAVAFAFYIGRFIGKAPIVVRLTENGLTIVYRSKEDSVSWDKFRKAHHVSEFGLQWRLELETRSLEVRDDGFSTRRWDEFSEAMTETLQAHDITVERDAVAEEFADDNAESNA